MSTFARFKGLIIAVVALGIAGGALAYLAWGNLGDNLIYYVSPGELLSRGQKLKNATVRLGGLVVPGSLQWNASHTELTFLLADSPAPDALTVRISSTTTPPQMFREGTGAVVEGALDDAQVFRATRLMVNHGNEYKPPQDKQELQAMLKEVERQQANR